jgi:DNA-directed RNA polymerase specialized sigma24 family protein
MVAYYNELLTRFALRFTGGNMLLAESLVKEAMEEAWEEDKFYDTPELRSLLHKKLVAKLLANNGRVTLN